MEPSKIIVFLTGMMLHSLSQAATPILSIVPSITSTMLRSDSQTTVLYTVTNNTSKSISDLSITPNYLTTGNANGISLYTNNCTGTLTAGGSCTFEVLIQGAGQPERFQISPKVCGYHQLFCSLPVSSGYVQISNNAINAYSFAYFSVNSGGNNNHIVPVNGQTFAVGTPLAIDTDQYIQGPVTVSPDGNTVYAAEQDGLGSLNILVISSGAMPHIQQRISLGYLPYFDVLVTTLDGRTIYAAASEASGVYRITNNNGSYTVSFISLPSGEDASGLAVSPDGSRLFIGSYDHARLNIMNTSTNEVIQTLSNSGTSCEFNAPGAIAVMPHGNTIYVANGYGSEGISVVEKNADGTYRCGNRITHPTQQLSSMILSSDGHFLYALGINPPQQLYIIDTTTNDQVTSLTVPTGSTGIAMTPDGTRLFISNSDSAYVYVLLNGLPTTASPSSINIGGGSQANGSFVG